MSFSGWYHNCAKYEGDESAVYDGEACVACGLTEDAYRLTRYGTNALRDELKRRGDLAPGFLWHATDDQLRAECERRGIPLRDDDVKTLTAALARENDAIIAERDEWKRQAEEAEMQLSASRALDRVREMQIYATTGADPSMSDHERHMKAHAEAFENYDRKRAEWESRQAPTRRVSLVNDSHWVDPWDFLEDA